MARRIGILGGTFDPVHLGHLILAVCARDQLACGELLLIPNVRSPIKPKGPVASFADRLAMIKLAIGQTPRLSVSDIEGRRESPSYTVDTLTALHAAYPDDELYLIVGSDAMRDFAAWHEAGRVPQLARIAVVARHGEQPVHDARVAQVIDMPRIDVSASDIRARIGRGLPIDFLTPPAVAAYIQQHALYRTS
jgi:nicotinate-nucleotide adenylyltransferase